MNKEKEEYVALRQEILDLCSSADRIINILYLFLAAYFGLVFGKEDTIYILPIHIIILPLYLLAIDRRIATCKASAYILVFHEKEGNKWETRLMEYKYLKEPIIFKHFSSKHFSFVFPNCVGLILFIYQTEWKCSMPTYEMTKVFLEFILFSLIMYLFIKYKKIQVKDYVKEWERIRDAEDSGNEEEYVKLIKEMSEKVTQEFFQKVLKEAKEGYSCIVDKKPPEA